MAKKAFENLKFRSTVTLMALKMNYILIQKDDIKSKNWGSSCAEIGVNLVAVPGSSAWMPIQLLISCFRLGRPSAVVYRYLNDYPSFFRSFFLKLVSELITVTICFLLKIRIIWFCHNVDAETTQNFPILTGFRRAMFAKFSANIFVMDSLLLRKAYEVFPMYKNKINYLCFGIDTSVEKKISVNKTFEERALMFIENAHANSDHNKLKIGFCPGTANAKSNKCIHFDLVKDLILEGEKAGIDIRMIVVGPISEYLKCNAPSVLEFINNDSRVLFVDDYIHYDNQIISKYINFYWRAYSDWSVGYTMYESCLVEKPILTFNAGFLGLAIPEYNLGAAISSDFSNIKKAFFKIDNWSYEFAKNFLEEHTWDIAANRLVCAIKEPNQLTNIAKQV